jgi:hypothetical protein
MLDNSTVRVKWVTEGADYVVYVYDIGFSGKVYLVDGSADHTDFVANYLPGGQSVTSPTDGDGADLTRVKVTEAGWHFQIHSLEWETSKLNSGCNRDETGADLGFITVKFYDSGDVELTTQVDIDANCVKTVVDWMPTFDYELLGGEMDQVTAPLTDVRLYILAAPGLPGGDTPFATGGINLRRIGDGGIVQIDGRTAKLLSYNGGVGSNKLRFITRHDAGVKCPVFLSMHLFKPA